MKEFTKEQDDELQRLCNEALECLQDAIPPLMVRQDGLYVAAFAQALLHVAADFMVSPFHDKTSEEHVREILEGIYSEMALTARSYMIEESSKLNMNPIVNNR